MTNIGTIFMQKKDYDMAYVCFNECENYMMMAIREDELRVEDGVSSVTDVAINKFILACR